MIYFMKSGFITAVCAAFLLVPFTSHADDTNVQAISGTEFLNYVVAYQEFIRTQSEANLENFTVKVNKDSTVTEIYFVPNLDYDDWKKNRSLYMGGNKYGKPVTYRIDNKTHKITQTTYSK
jgi:UPF0716 family protein affecting phage T7 exclusion